MGIFGTKKETPPPHPRREPRYDCPVTADAIANVFDRCADFNRRTLYLNNDPRRQVPPFRAALPAQLFYPVQNSRSP